MIWCTHFSLFSESWNESKLKTLHVRFLIVLLVPSYFLSFLSAPTIGSIFFANCSRHFFHPMDRLSIVKRICLQPTMKSATPNDFSTQCSPYDGICVRHREQQKCWFNKLKLVRLSSHGKHQLMNLLQGNWVWRNVEISSFTKSEMNRVRCWLSLIRVIHVIVSLRVHTQAEHCIRHQWRCYSADCFIKSVSRGNTVKAFSGGVNSVVRKISCRKVNNAIVPQLVAQKLKNLFDKKSF